MVMSASVQVDTSTALSVAVPVKLLVPSEMVAPSTMPLTTTARVSLPSASTRLALTPSAADATSSFVATVAGTESVGASATASTRTSIVPVVLSDNLLIVVSALVGVV